MVLRRAAKPIFPLFETLSRLPRHNQPGKPRGYGSKMPILKDKLERFLHDRVCDGTVRLSKARKAFRDWKAAFKRFDL
jgi:hypothetical protein